jgi:hypothetical protein
MDSMKGQRVVVVGGTSELRRRVAEAMPVGRMGTPDDIATRPCS